MQNTDLPKCLRVVDDLLVASINAELRGQFVLSNEIRQQLRGAKQATSRAMDADKRPYGSALTLRLNYIAKAKDAENRCQYVRASNLRDRAHGVAMILAVLRSSEKSRRKRMKRTEAMHKRRYAEKRRATKQLT